MARLSNIPLDDKTYRQILDILDQVLGKMKQEEVRALLFSLFGKNERIMVSKRFAAVLLLSRGIGISEVSRRLKMTKQTVIRLNMTKEIKSKGFLLAVKKVEKDKSNKHVIEILSNITETFEAGHRANPLKHYL